jgi:hypothetical protein
MAYTRGPWKVLGGTLISDESTEHDIFIGYSPESLDHFLDRYDEVRDNARLISACPEMLGVCESLVEWASKEHTYDELMAIIEKARAAIAKAIGS